MANFETALRGLFGEEGGFAPEDNGRGNVNRGVTQATLNEFWAKHKGLCKKLGLPKQVREFTRQHTRDFYEVFFWNPYRLGEVEDQQIAELLFQMIVNNPAKIAAGFAQATLGVDVDGVFGPQTLGALNGLDKQGRGRFIELFKSRLEARYRRLAEKDPKKYGDDLQGWLNRLGRL